jgi:toxin-antitoxin system PIN domain toxin
LILVDANLLIYAYDESSPFQAASRRWVESMLSGVEPVRLSWLTLMAFLRITTNPKLFERPLSTREAMDIVHEMTTAPSVKILNPGRRHLSILERLLAETGIRGPLVMDAHLAALAIENRATLCTTDRDFDRFQGLRLHFPLAPRAAH